MSTTKQVIFFSMLLFSLTNICSANNSQLEQAYNLALAGELQASEKLYQELIQDGQIAKHEIYFSKCLADINRLDIVGSDEYYDLAVNALKDVNNKDNILLEFNYRRAALLINKGESAKATIVLAAYVFKDNASVRMQSDYLDAHFRLGNYVQVVNDAHIFWANNYKNKPVYGIMPVADSLFKLKRFSEAEGIYNIILAAAPTNFFANLSLAYCLAMRDEEELAIALYDRAYALHPNAENIILNEANTLFAQGKRRLAKKLYKMLETKNELKKYNVILAKAMTFGNNGYILSSNQLLKSLTNTNQADINNRDYWQQKFTNSMNDELYHDAWQTIKKTSDTPLYNALKPMYKAARQGGVGASFLTTSNYKGNSIQSYRLDGDRYIGANTYLIGILDNSRFSDGVHTASVSTTTIGLSHRFERGRIYAAIANAVAGESHTLYDFGITYKIDDLTSIDFLTGKRHIEYAQAILNGFITERYYTIALARKINERNSFALDYTTASLSDTNRFSGYGISYSYYPVKEAQKTHEFYGYYRRSGFSKLSDLYESPDKRLAYGVGWQGRWNLKNNSYWIVKTNFELGHDNLEPTDLSPSIRVQYTHPVGKDQDLSAAVEYGVRTNRMNSTNSLLHGYKQFELRYNLSF